jgi:hypothetical protein
MKGRNKKKKRKREKESEKQRDNQTRSNRASERGVFGGYREKKEIRNGLLAISRLRAFIW